MPDKPRIFAAIAFALLATMLVRKWTGGGGGGGGGEIEWVPEPPVFDSAEKVLQQKGTDRTLSWQPPGQREDGSSLHTDALLGYVVVLLPAEASVNNEFSAPFQGLNSRQFNSKKKQIKQALSADVLDEFVKQHSAYAAVIPPQQNSIVIPLEDGRVFVAIAAIDANGLYGELSKTIALSAAGN